MNQDLENIYRKLNARDGKTKSAVTTVVVTGTIVASSVTASCSSCSTSHSPECIYAGPTQMGVVVDTVSYDPEVEEIYAGPVEMDSIEMEVRGEE